MHRNALFALYSGSAMGPHALVAELGPWMVIDSGYDEPAMNVAVPFDSLWDIRDLGRAAAWFAARGVSFCYLLEAERHSQSVASLAGRGLEISCSIPAMLMQPLTEPPAPVAGLRVRDVGSADEAALFAELGMDENGYPRETLHAIAGTAFRAEGFELLLGWLGDRAVASALAVMTPPMVGVYAVNVGVEHRRRGIGAAMTWAAIARGRSRGCSAAFLESSRSSHRLYERLGFVTAYHYVQIGCADPAALCDLA